MFKYTELKRRIGTLDIFLNLFILEIKMTRGLLCIQKKHVYVDC